jgi:hypothetical protein
MPYQYRPLESSTGEIRLLSISINDQHNLEDLDQSLYCSLLYVESRFGFPFKEHEIVDGDHSPWGDFAALSYEWAAPEPKRTILVDDEPYDVNPNLFEALLQIRRAARASNQQSLRLWVDAICIDQTSIEERNAQVPRMRYIYSSASTVYCHLTPYSLSHLYVPEAGTGQERDYEADMKLASLVIPEIANLSEDTRSNVIGALEDSIDVSQAKVWYVLLLFLENSYWTRLWIIQEIVLASKQIMILAAGSQFDFDEIDQVADMVREGLHTILGFLLRTFERNEYKPPAGLPNFKNIATQRLNRKLLSKDVTGYSNVDLDLASLLPVRSSRCTDPRDRIYGMLGLMSHAQAATVVIDYEKPVEEVYVDFMASLIGNTGSLFALSFFPFTSARNQVLPSWVPDLRDDSPFRGLTEFNVSSSLSELPRPKIVSGSHLVVSGLLLDRVDGLAATLLINGLEHLQASREIAKVTMSDQFTHAYKDLEGLRIAFWSTLQCVLDQNMDEPMPLTREEFTAMCETSGLARSIQKILQVNDGFLSSGYSLDSLFAAQSDEPVQELDAGDVSDLNEIFGRITELYLNRRMACTKGGRLGLVPADARKGDAIYALSGLDTLAVLRKHIDGWTFIGACYVYGWMDGESPDIVNHLAEAESITIV